MKTIIVLFVMLVMSSILWGDVADGPIVELGFGIASGRYPSSHDRVGWAISKVNHRYLALGQDYVVDGRYGRGREAVRVGVYYITYPFESWRGRPIQLQGGLGLGELGQHRSADNKVHRGIGWSFAAAYEGTVLHAPDYAGSIGINVFGVDDKYINYAVVLKVVFR
jgi:hypothetical protein